jgi:bacterioferritin
MVRLAKERKGFMKGNERLIEALNSILAEELTAINQYMVHAEMCGQWGYKNLHKHFEKRSIDEMKHAETVIERILFLEGTPIVSNLHKITIGDSVPKQLANDHALEEAAIRSYNSAIALAAEVKDFATHDLIKNILNVEDRHIDEIESLQDKIEQMTPQIFLSTQVNE